MRVLRVGTSNDSSGSLPEEQRGWHIASTMLADASGEPVDTILKRAWPTAEFPEHVARWLDEFEPDVVVLQVSNFWYGHESVPLWLERKFGRAGAYLSDAGLRLGKRRWFADSRLAIASSRALVRVLPSATHFTVQQVAATMEAGMQKVLSREGPILVVRGNDHWAKLPMSTRRANNRNIQRNAAMSRAMRAICERHRTPYVERPTVSEAEMRKMLNDARWHNSADGERISGEVDGRAMVAAWRGVRE